MPASRRSIPALTLAALLVLALALEAPRAWAAGPTTEIFPGCAPTLQGCLDSVDPGSTVLIDTETPVEEALLITRSVILRSAPGVRATVTLARVRADGSTGTIDVTIKDIDFTSSAEVTLSGGSGHHVALRKIAATGYVCSAAELSTSVPATLEVVNSTLTMSAHQCAGVYVGSSADSGLTTALVVGNRISGHGHADSGPGIRVDLRGDGTTRVDLLSNRVWDVGACACGGSSSVSVYATGAGHSDLDVVGGTLHRSGYAGLYVANDLVQPGRLAIDLFDTIISGADFFGVALDSTVPATMVFRAGRNDYFENAFGNDLDGQPSGSGHRQVAPGYVDKQDGDLRLTASSRLIDAGVVCSPGGVSIMDAAGKDRLVGPSVDIGAYEHGATAVTGEAFVGGPDDDDFDGTPGADIMCGYGGGDRLIGDGGTDYLDGGKGPDFVAGGTGPDRMFGGRGGDQLCGRDDVSGNDRLDGGPQTDRFRADPGDHRANVETNAGCAGT